MASEYVSRKSDDTSKVKTQTFAANKWQRLEVEGQTTVVPKYNSLAGADWAFYLNIKTPLIGGANEVMIKFVRNPGTANADETGRMTYFIKKGGQTWVRDTWLFQAVKGQPVAVEIMFNGKATISTREIKMAYGESKQMPWHIAHDIEGCKGGYAVVLDSTGETVTCHKTKEDAKAHLGALYANVPDVQKMQFGHGAKVPFYIEFNTPDAQGKWCVCKENNGQVVSSWDTQEEAQKALEQLTVQVEGYEEKGVYEDKKQPASFWNGAFAPMIGNGAVEKVLSKEQEGIGALYEWDGSFAPVFGTRDQDARMKSTYNSPPQHDGEPSAGYGNRSGKGQSNPGAITDIGEQA